MSNADPPDPTTPDAPWGPGWAEDGSYLPRPDPTAEQHPPGAAPPPPASRPPGPNAGPPPPWAASQNPSGPPPWQQQQQGTPAGGWAPPPQGGPPGPGFSGGGPPAQPGMVPLGWVQGPWGPRWRGPIGQARGIGVTILLSIITCGIWTWVWSYQNHDELQRYRSDGLGGPVGLILAVFVSVAVMFTIPMEIEQMYQEEGLQSPVSTMDGLWFLLPIIGNFIWYAKVQNGLNDFWVARGARPA